MATQYSCLDFSVHHPTHTCVTQSCLTLCNPMDRGQILSDSITFFKWATPKLKKKIGKYCDC